MKMDLKVTGCEGDRLMELSHNRVQWRSGVEPSGSITTELVTDILI